MARINPHNFLRAYPNLGAVYTLLAKRYSRLRREDPAALESGIPLGQLEAVAQCASLYVERMRRFPSSSYITSKTGLDNAAVEKSLELIFQYIPPKIKRLYPPEQSVVH